MKSGSIFVLSMILFLSAITTVAGTIVAGDRYTRDLDINPESSGSFARPLAKKTAVTVQLSGTDLGSTRIVAEVYDPSGRLVARGPGRISFRTQNVNGLYKIVVINKTKKRQKIAVSVDSENN